MCFLISFEIRFYIRLIYFYQIQMACLAHGVIVARFDCTVSSSLRTYLLSGCPAPAVTIRSSVTFARTHLVLYVRYSSCDVHVVNLQLYTREFGMRNQFLPTHMGIVVVEDDCYNIETSCYYC